MEWARSVGYPKLAELLHHNSESPEKETMALARLVAATYLIGDSDKHPKNIALLHSEENEPFRVTLVPAYDTVSVYCLKDMDFTQNQAIPIGQQYRRDRISARAIRQFAEDIGLDAEAVKSVFQDVAEKMPDAFNEVAAKKLQSEPVLDRDRAKIESGHDEEENQPRMQAIVAGVSAKRDEPAHGKYEPFVAGRMALEKS